MYFFFYLFFFQLKQLQYIREMENCFTLYAIVRYVVPAINGCIKRKHFSMPLIILPGKRAKQGKGCGMCQRSTHMMCFQIIKVI